MAEDFEQGGSPLYARLAREYADDPRLVRIAADHEPRWEVPLKVFAAVHHLALTGRVEDPWSSFGDVLESYADELRALRGRAAGPDERGSALLGAPARVPLGR